MSAITETREYAVVTNYKQVAKALMKTAKSGLVEIVQDLAAQPGVDVDAKNEHNATALMKAAEKRHLDVVTCLAQKYGADVNTRTNYGETLNTLPSQTYLVAAWVSSPDAGVYDDSKAPMQTESKTKKIVSG
ncbi:hypothetical protein ON010_g13450 [Phytophthora cinnamomi]|nr:hypothetical protein ON010_g13450 [Phytophthora cinnamomi]